MKARLVLMVGVAGMLAGIAQAQVNVTTWQDDVLRTGQNLNETILTPGNLASNNFGQLCSVGLDGQVYAQPLVLSNVTFQSTQYASLVYVLTQMNTLYVINGTPAQGNPCTVVASLSLTPSGQYPASCSFVGGGNCGAVDPVVGALGTPVIQSIANSNGMLYVVTESQDVASGMPKNWYHYLHAVNLDQLTESVPPVRIAPPGPYTNFAQQSYWSRHHVQRPGLLLVNLQGSNYLYIGFSMMDGVVPVFNGAIFRYDVSNLSVPPLYFATTPDFPRQGGGVWQGGAGLAYGPDENGTNALYFNTADGGYDGRVNWGDSFIKLDPGTLKPVASFTPADQAYRDCQNPFNDVDFGSGGVLLTPPSSNWPYLAISGDKEGAIWAMDRGIPGGFHLGQCPSTCTQQNNYGFCDPATQDKANQNVQTVWLGSGHGPAIHNTAAYWNNNIYMAPVRSPILQFAICSGAGQPLCSDPVKAVGFNNGNPTTIYGATPTISASSESTNGILWLITGANVPLSTAPGVLLAFDATTMKQLYASSGIGNTCAGDLMNPAVKYAVPTVANGYVYVGAEFLNGSQQNTGQGSFYIFGLNRNCNINRPKSKGRPVMTIRK